MPFPDNSGYRVLEDDFVDFCRFDEVWAEDDETNNILWDPLCTDERAVSVSATPHGTGCWVFTDKGRAISFGSARWCGDMSGVVLNGPVLDSVATPRAGAMTWSPPTVENALSETPGSRA